MSQICWLQLIQSEKIDTKEYFAFLPFKITPKHAVAEKKFNQFVCINDKWKETNNLTNTQFVYGKNNVYLQHAYSNVVIPKWFILHVLDFVYLDLNASQTFEVEFLVQFRTRSIIFL